MNTITNFVIFASLSTFISSIISIFIVTIYAQPAVKEILIGPDPSKNGDDTYTPNNVAIDKGDRVMWVNKDFGIHIVTEPSIIYF